MREENGKNLSMQVIDIKRSTSLKSAIPSRPEANIR